MLIDVDKQYDRLTKNRCFFLTDQLEPKSASLREIAVLLAIIGAYLVIFMLSGFSLKLLIGAVVTLIPSAVLFIKVEKVHHEEEEALEFIKMLERAYQDGDIEIIYK